MLIKEISIHLPEIYFKKHFRMANLGVTKAMHVILGNLAKSCGL